MAKKNMERALAAKRTTLERQNMIGPKMNFAAAEAYKLLRTNVMFSFPNANGCRVLGVTSSFRGEGKSLTSINLAYTLAEAKKAVLLIERDMRLPTMAGRLAVAGKPGLSNVLVGTDSMDRSFQKYVVAEEGRTVSFDVLVSGDIPPTPSELLGSVQMSEFLVRMKEQYDVIILDLPPVMAVSDAVVASHLVDGMIVVVRAEHTVRGGLADTMRQLSLADAHILGFVFNGAAAASGGKYYKKGYYSSDYYGGSRK